jgi:hypothetical protein
MTLKLRHLPRAGHLSIFLFRIIGNQTGMGRNHTGCGEYRQEDSVFHGGIWDFRGLVKTARSRNGFELPGVANSFQLKSFTGDASRG